MGPALGGKVKATTTLGKLAAHAGLYPLRQGIEIGLDTTYDVYHKGQDFHTSLTYNAVGSVLGEAGGRRAIVGRRRFWNSSVL